MLSFCGVVLRDAIGISCAMEKLDWTCYVWYVEVFKYSQVFNFNSLVALSNFRRIKCHQEVVTSQNKTYNIQMNLSAT